MTSATITAVLQQHDDNQLLNTAAPPLMRQSPGDLSVDQPAGQVTSEMVASSVQALRQGQTHYVDVPGIGPLREALAQYLNDTFGAGYQSDNVLVTAGVQESRFLSVQKIGEQYDTIAFPAVVHPGMRRALGTRPLAAVEIPVSAENGYLPTVDALRSVLEEGSRLLYLESPSRLTGQAYDADTVAAIAGLLQEFDAGVIWDQGLAPWVAEGEYASIAAHEALREQSAVLGEAWPGAGLDSWFIGYVAAPADWFEPMRSQKQIMAICTSTASQYAALAAGEQFSETVAAQRQQLADSRRQAAAGAREAGLIPVAGTAANILALELAEDEKAQTVQKLAEAGYTVADGAAFGAPGSVRLAVSLDETTTNALQRLAQ